MVGRTAISRQMAQLSSSRSCSMHTSLRSRWGRLSGGWGHAQAGESARLLQGSPGGREALRIVIGHGRDVRSILRPALRARPGARGKRRGSQRPVDGGTSGEGSGSRRHHLAALSGVPSCWLLLDNERIVVALICSVTSSSSSSASPRAPPIPDPGVIGLRDMLAGCCSYRIASGRGGAVARLSLLRACCASAPAPPCRSWRRVGRAISVVVYACAGLRCGGWGDAAVDGEFARSRWGRGRRGFWHARLLMRRVRHPSKAARQRAPAEGCLSCPNQGGPHQPQARAASPLGPARMLEPGDCNTGSAARWPVRR